MTEKTTRSELDVNNKDLPQKKYTEDISIQREKICPVTDMSKCGEIISIC